MNELEIPGVYRDGRVELESLPPHIQEAKVRVLFESADVDANSRVRAVHDFMALLRKGMPLGGSPYPRREDLYDRKICRDAGNR